MRLFLPSARAMNWLLIVGSASLGYALYLRYMGIEQSGVGLACAAGLNTWLCFTRKIAVALYMHSVFGGIALAVAVLNFIRPSLILFAVALAVSAFGVVLYNAGLSALTVGVLVLSLARRAPEPE